MTEKQEISDRNRVRRQMALASMVLVWAIVIAFLWGLASDDIADRVAKVWPAFTTIFPALMAYVGFYAKLGSDETKHAADLKSRE